MVIDYSRWDNLKLSDSDDEESQNNDTVEGDLEHPRTARDSIASVQRSSEALPDFSYRLSSEEGTTTTGNDLSEEQWAGIPKMAILVHSQIRKRILEQMLQNGMPYARPFGPYGILLPVGFLVSEMEFCGFFPGFGYDGGAKLVAALLSMPTECYMSIVGNEERSKGLMATAPYDAQFRGDPLSFRDGALHLRYGQCRQLLYQRVPGPEFVRCEMGPLCGGPVVILRAKMTHDYVGIPQYLMEHFDFDEAAIPGLVTELLEKAEY